MNGPGEQVRRPARAPKPTQAAPPVAASGSGSGTASQQSPADPYYGHEEVAKMCARFISDLFHCPDSAVVAPPAAPAPGGAPAPSPTAPPLANFIAYALHRTRLHSCVTFTALFLLQRLKTRFPAARGSSGHRLFISAFMIASKVVCDDTYSNKSWCVVGQGMFSLKEINQMEREMCSYLEWKLNFVPSELADFEVRVRREQNPRRAPVVPPIVTAPLGAPSSSSSSSSSHSHSHSQSHGYQGQQHGKGSYPSPPDSPTTPASSHSSTASPQSAAIITPPSSDDTTSIASSKTASSMFSSASASTGATSLVSSSSAHGAPPAGKTGGEPGFAFASRSVW